MSYKGQAHLGSWRLYLNGIETPAQSVSISLGVGLNPVASITLAPDQELLRLGAEDRMHVAVFYLDDVRTQVENVDPDYRLLYEGEITGWSYQTTPSGRAISLQSVGLAAVLEQIRPNLISSISDIAASATTHTPGTLDHNMTLGAYPASLFFQGLRPDKDGAGGIKRPYDLIQNIFKSLFSATERNGPQSSSSAHFFARWARRTNFLNRWVPSPFIENMDLQLQHNGMFPIFWAMQSQAVVDSVMKHASVDAHRSLMDMIMSIFPEAMYDIAMLPNMPMVQVELATGRIMGKPVLPDKRGAVGAVTDTPTTPNRILNFVTKPALQYCVPPRCNVIFPSMIRSYGLSENFSAQPTRVYLANDKLKDLVFGANSNDAMMAGALMTAWPQVASNFLELQKKNHAFSSRNYLSFPEEYYKGPVVREENISTWHAALSSGLASNLSDSKDNIDARLSKIQDMMHRFAAYSYIRLRGEAKSGAATLRFNPYVVPGFPGVIFDGEETNVHVFCYIQNVTHSLSSSGLDTSIAFSCVQTFDEFFDALVDARAFSLVDSLPEAAKVAQAKLVATRAALNDATPATVAQLRTAYEVALAEWTTATASEQGKYSTALAAASSRVDSANSSGDSAKMAAATKAYQEALSAVQVLSGAMTYPDAAPLSPTPDIQVRFQNTVNASDYYTALFYQTEMPTGGAAFDWAKMIGAMDDTNPLADPTAIELGTAVGGKLSSPAIRSGYHAYALREPYRQLVNDTEAAMQWVSRPIVSLDDWIEFQGDRGVRQFEESEFGVKYYAKILDLVQGPGVAPTLDAYGYPLTTLTADTRRDWETRLFNYRQKVRSRRPFKA